MKRIVLKPKVEIGEIAELQEEWGAIQKYANGQFYLQLLNGEQMMIGLREEFDIIESPNIQEKRLTSIEGLLEQLINMQDDIDMANHKIKELNNYVMEKKIYISKKEYCQCDFKGTIVGKSEGSEFIHSECGKPWVSKEKPHPTSEGLTCKRCGFDGFYALNDGLCSYCYKKKCDCDNNDNEYCDKCKALLDIKVDTDGSAEDVEYCECEKIRSWNDVCVICQKPAKSFITTEGNPFKVGNRVNVFSGRPTFTGTITAINEQFPDKVFVTEDGFYSSHNDSPFHYKQCELYEEQK